MTTMSHSAMIEFVAQTLGDTGISHLEKLATALYVTLNGESTEVDERAHQIHDLKPHINLPQAEVAIKKN